MQITLHADLDGIPASAWNELAAAGISDTPFARYEYMRQWWNTRGGGEWADPQMVIVSAESQGRLAGVCPLFIAEHAGRRALLLLGSIEVSDYLDLIVRPADVGAFAAAVLDALQQSDHLRGLPLDLYNIPEDSPTLPALQAEAQRRGRMYRQEVYKPTPQIHLASDFDAYLARLEKKQRHEIRRKLRRAAEAPIPAIFELVGDERQLESAIEDFLELMTHDPDKARFLGQPMREHMRGVMRSAWKNGLLWLAFLNVGGSRAAASLNFDYRNRLWGYNSAVHREYLPISPGWVLLAHELQWACEHGREVFDFMRGEEAYKYRFGATDRHVMRAVLQPG